MRNSDIKDELARAYYAHLTREQEKARREAKKVQCDAHVQDWLGWREQETLARLFLRKVQS